MIDKVIDWKFNAQGGMRCKEIDGVMTIIDFPGGIPSIEDQALWTQEYLNWIEAGGELDKKADLNNFDELLKAFALVVFDEINLLRTQAGLPERTLQQLKNAIKAKL